MMYNMHAGLFMPTQIAPAHALPSTSNMPSQSPTCCFWSPQCGPSQGRSHACLGLKLAGGRHICCKLAMGVLVKGRGGRHALGRSSGAVSASSRGCRALRLGSRPHALCAHRHARCFMVPCANVEQVLTLPILGKACACPAENAWRPAMSILSCLIFMMTQGAHLACMAPPSCMRMMQAT